MRRKDKEIRDSDKISTIIRSCTVCRLGLSQDDVAYIVPVSFGFDGGALYFHTGREGRKIDILSANNKVCFEFESGVKVIADEEKPCNWSFSFQSVIGFGVVKELVKTEEKAVALKQIMVQYSDKNWDFTNTPLAGVRVWKITIERVTGKQSLDHVEQ